MNLLDQYAEIETAADDHAGGEPETFSEAVLKEAN